VKVDFKIKSQTFGYEIFNHDCKTHNYFIGYIQYRKLFNITIRNLSDNKIVHYTETTGISNYRGVFNFIKAHTKLGASVES